MNEHHDHSHVSGSKLFWTILFNLGITIAEFVGGIVSGYLALLADAVHNLSDVAALILAWLGVKGSAMPATKRSTYGYKRIEVMTAMLSAVALVVIAVFIIREAYLRMIDPQPITHPWLFLSVAIIGLIGNIVSVWLLHSEKGKSLNMKTAFLHMAYDAVSSVGVIIGGIVILLTGWMIIDIILSCLIALAIVYSSYLVIKEAMLIFLEAAPEGIDFDAVLDTIKRVDHVQDCHHLHIWSLSSKEVALSCHVCIDESDFQDGPEVIGAINRMLHEKYTIGHATIQIEKIRCETDDPSCNNQEQSIT
ncbi:MAG: cation diffusion facilitator family transporter [candidate division Zixibacteria bacterium]|nr:cation diffusion facilitator family transporter [candidate division Zixibacteria bacterium]MDH3937436.1 cation diffusion facilitator family transporter [candidate division Zixibacteria bacterium]